MGHSGIHVSIHGAIELYYLLLPLTRLINYPKTGSMASACGWLVDTHVINIILINYCVITQD